VVGLAEPAGLSKLKPIAPAMKRLPRVAARRSRSACPSSWRVSAAAREIDLTDTLLRPRGLSPSLDWYRL
jgi:hypothetical protein